MNRWAGWVVVAGLFVGCSGDSEADRGGAGGTAGNRLADGGLGTAGSAGISAPTAAIGGTTGAVPDAGSADDDAGAERLDGGTPGCSFEPPIGQFEPDLECSWTFPGAEQPYPGSSDVVMTPVVINLTDDNGDDLVDLADDPDIAFVSYQLSNSGCPTMPASHVCNCCAASGVLRVVSGRCNDDGTMVEHYSVGALEIEADIGVADVWLDNDSGLAVGDIDKDGSVDIVGTTLPRGTIAFERDGKVKWYQPDYPGEYGGTIPSIADLDADGKPEVIQGRVVLNGEDGTLQWKGTGKAGRNPAGPVSHAADVDLDGKLNLVAGNTLYDHDGTVMWTYTFEDTACANCEGFSATGNFDGDDEGEIVLTRDGKVYILKASGELLVVGGLPAKIDVPVDDCANNEGGAPTVADFDGDGQAEIGVAGADFYVVVDLECLADPLPGQCSDPGILWKLPNADCSSRITGSSVFDFEGDGRAEVVYNDEQFFRIIDGTDGTVRNQVPNKSHTRLEMPVVADVDNDGNAEIVFITNRWSGEDRGGIKIYGDATNSWVATRRIWNQHTYHVTNVTELGGIPKKESPNWLQPTDATESGVMNNFRQNLPEFDVFAAPDLTVTLEIDRDPCPGQLDLVARVCNEGDLVVGAGVVVRFYDNSDESRITCDDDPTETTASLLPSTCRKVTCRWSGVNKDEVDVRACVDNKGYKCVKPTSGGNNECVEDNNRFDGTAEGCPDVE